PPGLWWRRRTWSGRSSVFSLSVSGDLFGVGGDGQELVDGSESVSAGQQGVDDDLHGGDGGGAVSAAAVDAVVEDQQPAGAGPTDGAGGDPRRGPLSDLKRVAENSGHRLHALVLQCSEQRWDAQ